MTSFLFKVNQLVLRKLPYFHFVPNLLVFFFFFFFFGVQWSGWFPQGATKSLNQGSNRRPGGFQGNVFPTERSLGFYQFFIFSINHGNDLHPFILHPINNSSLRSL